VPKRLVHMTSPPEDRGSTWHDDRPTQSRGSGPETTQDRITDGLVALSRKSG